MFVANASINYLQLSVNFQRRIYYFNWQNSVSPFRKLLYNNFATDPK